jgi:hypothetical protein
MKIICTFLCFSLTATMALAQLAISADNTQPDPSAILDVSSTTRGFLLPRMSSGQRTSIASPAMGLMVYDNDTRLFHFHDGIAWRQLGSTSNWNTSATRAHIYTTSDSVGIGTSSPQEKLHISNGQIRLSRSASFENSIVFNMPPPNIAAAENEGLKFRLSDVDKAFLGYTSSSFAGSYFRISGSGLGGSDLVINSAGNTGLGTTSPAEKLHVVGNVLLNTTNPTIQLRNAGVDKGFVQLSGDNLRLGANSSNAAGKVIFRLNGADQVFIQPDGKTGIGQDNPDAKLHINSGSSLETLRLTGNTNTIIRFMTGTTDKANIYAANNHLSITTVQPGGQVRLGNEVYIDEDADRVGIGTSVPDQRLHVAGNVKVTGGQVLNSENINMIPIAMAFFDANANKVRGTANISAYRTSANDSFRYFVVTVSGVTDLSQAIIHITGIGAQVWGSVGGINGNQVHALLYDNILSEETSWQSFYITIYN